MEIEGGCFCGAIRFRIAGPPRRVTHCHCIHCRRTAGAPLVTWAEVEAASFRLTEGTPGEYSTRTGVTRTFCRECGTQLTYQHEDTSDSIDVTACSLDDPAAVTPEDHVWCDRMLPWMHVEDGLPRYARGRNDS